MHPFADKMARVNLSFHRLSPQGDRRHLRGQKKLEEKRRFSQITGEDAGYPNGPLARGTKMRGEVTGRTWD